MRCEEYVYRLFWRFYVCIFVELVRRCVLTLFGEITTLQNLPLVVSLYNNVTALSSCLSEGFLHFIERVIRSLYSVLVFAGEGGQGPALRLDLKRPVCCDKTRLLSRQKYACLDKTFVVTKLCLSRLNIFVAREKMLRQIFVVQMFVATKDLWRQAYFCLNKRRALSR